MKSNIKMVLGAVSAALVMMVSVASASDTYEFRGNSGCLRAIEGAQLAWDIAKQSRDLAPDHPDRDSTWRRASEVNSACYDVARSICGSNNGFQNPPPKVGSVDTCQDALDGTLPGEVGKITQTGDSIPIGGGIHMVDMTIHLDAEGADEAVVNFTLDDEDGEVKFINDGSGNNRALFISGGWSGTPGVNCRSEYKDDLKSIRLSDLVRNVPSNRRNKVDEDKLNCTFFMAQPFTVKVGPKS